MVTSSCTNGVGQQMFADGSRPFACFLYIAFDLGGGHLSYSGRIAGIVIWTFFASPFVATLLALIAATERRWWLLLAAVWLVAVSYKLLNLSRHPFDL